MYIIIQIVNTSTYNQAVDLGCKLTLTVVLIKGLGEVNSDSLANCCLISP